MKPIYLDHSATTFIRTEVLEAMHPYFTDIFGNAPSIHAFGQNAEKGLEDSREKGARLIGAQPSEIIGVGRLKSASSLNKKGMAASRYGGRMVKGRVLVAMSGGVDSSLTAYLLKEAGYQVIGVTMRIWDSGKDFPSDGPKDYFGCCGVADVEDARRVAQKLGIPFYVLNLKEQFEDEVVAYFCREYLNGRTPNPCILCNEKVKFGALLGKARELEAPFISTGHYARVGYDRGRKRFLLKRGKDPKKDQSYVLFSLSQTQLAHALFPLGYARKEEVRKKARDLGLRVHDKPESQEICFIPGRDYRPFLKRRASSEIEAGDIVDSQGQILGRHRGLPFYTVGQRKGLGLSAGKPLYVVELNRERNLMFVGEKEQVYGTGLIADRANWLSMDELHQPIRVKAKIRYSHREADATVEPLKDGKVKVEFGQPQEAITPGQAVVFYDGDVVLGGGWIERAIRT